MVGIIMKDMFGTDLKVGDNVVLVASAGSRHFERAVITEVTPDSVKMIFSGEGSIYRSRGGRKSGGTSRTTVPEVKVMICNSNSGAEVTVYKSERSRFEKDLKSKQSQLDTALKRVSELREENTLLRAEVEEIHSRFDILDL